MRAGTKRQHEPYKIRPRIVVASFMSLELVQVNRSNVSTAYVGF